MSFIKKRFPSLSIRKPSATPIHHNSYSPSTLLAKSKAQMSREYSRSRYVQIFSKFGRALVVDWDWSVSTTDKKLDERGKRGKGCSISLWD